MKRLHAILITLGAFIIFFFVLPFIFNLMNVQSVFLDALFRFLSIVSIPIIMFYIFEEKGIFRVLAIIFMCVNLAYFFANLLIIKIGIIFAFYYFTAYVVPIGLFILGLVFKQAYYSRYRVGFIIILTALVIKFAFMAQALIIMSYGSEVVHEQIMWGSIFQTQMTFFFMFLFQFITLNTIISERNRFY